MGEIRSEARKFGRAEVKGVKRYLFPFASALQLFRASALILIFIVIIGCGTMESRNDTASPAVKDEVNDTFTETVDPPAKSGNMTDNITGYSIPGVPMRLPGKVIRIYIAPMKSPMGRLIGEHYVWAIVREESWWTPGDTGLDTIVPGDIHRKNASEEERR